MDLHSASAFDLLCWSDADWSAALAGPKGRPLSSLDLAGVATALEGAKEVVVLLGAGASTAAGIPDFRSANGLYASLGMENPEQVFTREFLEERPADFYSVLRKLMSTRASPTRVHRLVSQLARKGKLRRCYTQNLDRLEVQAGVPPEKLVYAHGSFDTATCLETGDAVPAEELRAAVLDGTWEELREQHGGLVKPGIVLFGEPLPPRFDELHAEDLQQADLLLVFGTSLQVAPFAGLIEKVAPTVPRVLFNRDPVALAPDCAKAWFNGAPLGGFRFELEDNGRDVFVSGQCDDGAMELAELMGWTEDLVCVTPVLSPCTDARKPSDVDEDQPSTPLQTFRVF